ncbi:MAG: phosphoribosyl-AMP cyclohydrolase [Verrucomicrobiota bacterium]
MSDIIFAERTSKQTIEGDMALAPKFDDAGLIVAVAQDADTNEVLMVAYMNEKSLKMTIEKGEAVYFSRSRQEIWHKGATSGHVQVVEKILTDCDQDALVLKVKQIGAGCCHVGYRSCFYRNVEGPGNPVPLGQEIDDKSYDANKVYGKK